LEYDWKCRKLDADCTDIIDNKGAFILIHPKDLEIEDILSITLTISMKNDV